MFGSDILGDNDAHVYKVFRSGGDIGEINAEDIAALFPGEGGEQVQGLEHIQWDGNNGGDNNLDQFDLDAMDW